MSKRVIISVSDKTGIKELAKGLAGLGWEIISTGGTAKYLTESGIKVTPVSEVTNFHEIMDGRVKTLHPAILAGILADKSKQSHLDQLGQLGISPIDLVIVNLYPFEEFIQGHPELVSGSQQIPNQVRDDYDTEAIEQVDIGGPTMLRAAAKNFHSITVVVDPNDYETVLEELKKGDVSLETRKRLAAKVFAHTAKYDGAIANYFSKGEYLNLNFKKVSDLRYGENPHQQAAFYKDYGHSGAEQGGAIESRSYRPSASRMTDEASIVNAQVLQGGVVKLSSTTPQGKELSFNNILDANAALNLIQEFEEPAAAVIKHNNPCGVAVEAEERGTSRLPLSRNDAEKITSAFKKAWEADPLSAFGGIVALNRACTPEIAEALTKVFIEIVLAPDFSPESLELFKSKPNVRLLKLPPIVSPPKKGEMKEGVLSSKDFKRVSGGLLVQDADTSRVTETDLKFVTKKHPSEEEMRDMLFAWKVAKHCKSNAIVLAHNGVTVGLGLGQTSRVGSIKIAINQFKNQPFNHSTMNHLACASDAFFPFRDSIDELAKAGVTAIIQPGGSKNDGEVISAADEHNISMAFTGIRVFRH